MTIESDILEIYPICETDLAQRAHARLANQYQESEKLTGELRGIVSEISKIRDALCECLTLRWIDVAEGVNLDMLGAIVGQPRTSIVAGDLFYFGYFGNPQAKGYGDGRYRAIGEVITGAVRLTDPEYRLFIRAKAFANQSASTPDELSRHIFLVIGKSAEITNGRAKLDITFYEPITENEKVLLEYQWVDARGQIRDFIPYTLGVEREFFYL